MELKDLSQVSELNISKTPKETAKEKVLGWSLILATPLHLEQDRSLLVLYCVEFGKNITTETFSKDSAFKDALPYL